MNKQKVWTGNKVIKKEQAMKKINMIKENE